MADIENIQKRLKELEKENQQLNERLQWIQQNNDRAWKRRKLLLRGAGGFFLGWRLKKSVKKLFDEIACQKVQRETLSDVATFFLWRITRIGIFGIIGAIIPLLFLGFQTYYLRQQNQKLDVQNRRLDQQTYLQEAERRGSLVFLFSDVLDNIDRELGAIENTKDTLSKPLIGRILSLSESFKPYQYLLGDSLVSTPVSPERGHLLFAIANSGIDSLQKRDILSSINLTSADLGMAYLYRYDLSHAYLTQANFKGANLGRANFYKATLNGANFREANLFEARLRGANLEEADFKMASLSNVKLVGANLRRANFHGANLSRADFRETKLEGANFTVADLSGAKMYESDLRNTKFFAAKLTMVDLYQADLTGANLTRSKLKSAKLHRATLKNADLRWANLSGANLKETDLRKANLSNADLSNADLSNADLRSTILLKANLSGVNLEGAIVSGQYWLENLERNKVIGSKKINRDFEVEESSENFFILKKR
jgi:uncharacterized protein YjbI with pentapeptide repeats